MLLSADRIKSWGGCAQPQKSRAAAGAGGANAIEDRRKETHIAGTNDAKQ